MLSPYIETAQKKPGMVHYLQALLERVRVITLPVRRTNWRARRRMFAAGLNASSRRLIASAVRELAGQEDRRRNCYHLDV